MPVGPSHADQDVDIDLAQLLAAVWRRKGRVLALTCLMAGVAFAGASLIKPTYRAETTVLIEPRAPNYDAENAKSADSQPVLDELNIASQVQLFRSVDLIRQVVRDLKLYELKEFDPDLHPSALTDLLVMLHLKKNPLELSPEDRVIKTFSEKLQVYQVEKSRVIGVEFSSRDPKLAAAIPNAMVNVYLAVQSGAKLDSNEDAARWLEPEIANLRQKVAEAEQKVADYRKSSDLIPAGDSSSFASKQLNDISAELLRVRTDRSNAEARLQNLKSALKSGQTADNLDVVMGSPAIQSLKQSEATLKAQISDLSISLLDNHPRLKALKAQLASIQTQLQTETRKLASSLENDANIARIREEQLMQQLAAIKADTATAGEKEVGLKALEREAAAQRQLLETYLARYREASSRIDPNATPADARIISRAMQPGEPNFPKVLPITLVAGVATFVVSTIVIMLLELFSGRALRPVGPAPQPQRPRSRRDEQDEWDDVPTQRRQTHHDEQKDSPVRPIIAASEPQPAAIRFVEPQHEAASEYSIAAVAQYLSKRGVAKVIVLSPDGDAGSAATVTLARYVADAGRSVILVDMTGSGAPTLAMAQHHDLPGVTDLLCGDAAFGETIHADRSSSAHILPQGAADIRQALRGLDRLTMITDALTDAYDLVVVECGPTTVDNILRLCRDGGQEIILSVPQPDTAELSLLMEQFEAHGVGDLLLMSEAADFLPEEDVIAPAPRAASA
ncbi:GumC family protein [Allorhizobium undicola]|uniref:GumC family protein n=1 Tax=Allorhizobium undicola TaxID=78527 RepID=UPI00055BB477|nr:Wzz/FepE/Etk N-terminal domain-containing protein [Allorhizobium undicola]